MVTTLSLHIDSTVCTRELPLLITTALGEPVGIPESRLGSVMAYLHGALDRPPHGIPEEKMTYGISSPLYSSQFVQGTVTTIGRFCNALVFEVC